MNAVAEATAPATAEKIPFCSKSFEDGVFKFAFGNGTVLSLAMSEIPEETVQQLAAHGGLQKIGDSYAAAGGDYAFGIAQAERTISNLKNGVFNAGRASGGPSKDLRYIFAAISALMGISAEEAANRYDAATEDQQKALRTHPAIKAHVLQAKAAEAADAAAKAAPLFG